MRDVKRDTSRVLGGLGGLMNNEMDGLPIQIRPENNPPLTTHTKRDSLSDIQDNRWLFA
jgi:hypothetical protein